VESLQPLGDQAVLASFATEDSAAGWAAAVRRLSRPWLVDVVQAYTTVAVFFDLDRTTFAAVAEVLRELGREAEAGAQATGRLHHIPCCYELQQDLDRVARPTGLSPD